MPKLKITQTRSAIRSNANVKRTLEALGLGRIGKTNELTDTPQIRGMLARVGHLVAVEETAEA